MKKKSDDKRPIKNFLRELRESLNLTQEKFGEPLFVSRHDISRYEKGDHITVELLMKIHRVYGFTPDQVLLTGIRVESGRELSVTGTAKREDGSLKLSIDLRPE